ncbi:hypothetical protein IFO70_20635 [Phormidium tenue FACHB-886]|nr:hypothetical protein [Phormidium tenue FACHB-886]
MPKGRELSNDLKLKIYPAVIGVLGLCLLASLLSRFEVQIFTESAPLIDRPSSDADRATDRNSPAPPAPVAPAPVASSTPTPLATPAAVPAGTAGSLRVSNQTIYPVRVALLPLSNSTAPKAAPEQANSQKIDAQPVHWDFAPNEGSTKGLKLSLPEDDLQIEAGDVLVAFAQDGSRRYWGPFIAGKTALPLWNAATQEWQLNLQP